MANITTIILVSFLSSSLLLLDAVEGSDFKNESLVRIEVQSIAESPRWTKYQMSITKVYVGVDELVGVPLLFQQLTSGPGFGGHIVFWPPLKKGETIIGFVNVQNDVPRLDNMRNSFASWMRLPARSNGSDEEDASLFAATEKWASAYENFDAIAEEKRVEALQRLILDENSMISRWAAFMLGSRGEYTNLDLLRKIVQSNDPFVHARLAADLELASSIDSVLWRKSDERQKAFLSISTMKLSKDDLRTFAGQIVNGVKHHDFTKELSAQLIALLENNTTIDDTWKHEVLGAIRRQLDSVPSSNGDQH